MHNGKLIVFEGIDGAGKATQAKLLAKRLRTRGKHVAVFDFPNYKTRIGQLIRDHLRGKWGDFLNVSPYLASLLFALDRAQAVPKLSSALERGIVICDRYTQSAAFQAAKLPRAKRAAFVKEIENLEYRTLHIPKPDIIILLDISVPNAQELIATKSKDQHERDKAFQSRVASVYQMLAKQKNWITIPCVKNGAIFSRAEIHARILSALNL